MNFALNRNTIIVVFIVTVSIRIILSIIALDFLGSKLNVDFNHVPDGYDHIAENIIAGHGFWGHGGPTFERGPIYPLLIALFFIVIGKSAFAVRLLLSIIDGITAMVVYHIGKRLSSNRTGLLSAYVFALYPLSIWYTLKMWSEPLLALAIAGSTLLMIKSSEELSVKNSILLGVCIGISALIKQVALFLPAFIFIGYLILRKYKISKLVPKFLLTVSAMIIVVLPWTIRNYVHSKQIIPVHTLGGFNVTFGNLWYENYRNDVGKTMDVSELFQKVNKTEIREILTEAGMEYEQGKYIIVDPTADKILWKHGMQYLLGNPVKLIGKMIFFLPKFWYFMDTNNRIFYGLVINLPLYFLALYGIYMLFKKWATESKTTVVAIFTTILYFNLVHAPVIALFRYALPIIPLVIVISSYGLESLLTPLAQRIIKITGEVE